MGKIKGWTKTRDKKSVEWQNGNKTMIVRIIVDGLWSVSLSDSNTIYLDEKFKTKQGAINYAVNFMRGHEDG